MKRVIINVKEGKFKFFMELIRSLDFVSVDEEGDSSEAILSNIEQGLKEVKMIRKGQLKSTPAKDFLDEL